MSKSSEVFIDSSVLIAATISRKGTARDLIVSGFRGEHTLAVSPLVFEEVERNLVAKNSAALPLFYTFKDVLIKHLIHPPPALVIEAATVVAEKDAPIVAAAVHARAMYLATYDRQHLLALQEEIKMAFGLIVATPHDILSTNR